MVKPKNIFPKIFLSLVKTFSKTEVERKRFPLKMRVLRENQILISAQSDNF